MGASATCKAIRDKEDKGLRRFLWTGMSYLTRLK